VADHDRRARAPGPAPLAGRSAGRCAKYCARNRLRCGLGQGALRLRAERVDGSFAHLLGRGGSRRTNLSGPETVQKRRLVYVANCHGRLIVCALVCMGNPNERAANFSLTNLATNAISSSSYRRARPETAAP
jgi:hypothetical protein